MMFNVSMTKYVVFAMLLVSVNVFAATNPYGDFVSGSSSAPSAGTVVADSGSMAQIGPDHDYYDLNFITSCSLACTLEIGIFDASGNPLSTYKTLQLAGSTISTRLPKVTVLNNQRFEVRVSTLNLGTVSAGIALDITAVD